MAKTVITNMIMLEVEGKLYEEILIWVENIIDKIIFLVYSDCGSSNTSI